MRAVHFVAAAILALGAAGQATAATILVDFEDGTVGSFYEPTGPFAEHLGVPGVIAEDAGGKFMQFGLSGSNEYFLIDRGPVYHLPNGVREQTVATLKSFDILMPGGGKFWSNVFGSHDVDPGVWTHFSSPFYSPYGAVIVTTVGGPTFIDNVVFEEGVSSQYVPEPATWMVMIAGFGLAGLALRRRRAVFA